MLRPVLLAEKPARFLLNQEATGQSIATNALKNKKEHKLFKNNSKNSRKSREFLVTTKLSWKLEI